MADELVLHVGPHKTGSTALQKMLLSRRSALARLGIVCPETGWQMFGHYDLVDTLTRRRKAADLEALQKETANARTVLLSSEGFVVMDVPALERLRDLFPGTRVRVIHYLRNLCDIWPSHWQELVKHGQSMSFAQYVMQAALGWPETGWTALNQFDQLAKLRHVFGAKSLTIISYDLLQSRQVSLAPHFFSTVFGLEGDPWDAPAPPINLSLQDWQIELIRVLNGLHRDLLGGPETGELRAVLLKRLEKAEPDWLATFKARVAEAPTIDLASDGPCIDMLQRRVVGDFGPAFEDRKEAIEAYLATRTRRVGLFELSPVQDDPLREPLQAYYRAVSSELG